MRHFYQLPQSNFHRKWLPLHDITKCKHIMVVIIPFRTMLVLQWGAGLL